MKKSLNIFVWAVLLFLITPSSMALASWNAVPGDYTYSWKLSLERVLLLFLSPSNKLQSSTQIKIAERRYSEFEQVLDSEYAIESLNSLNKQLETTSADIQKINQVESREEVTNQYIESLKKMSVALSEQKSKAQTGEIAIISQKKNSNNINQVSNEPSVKPAVKPTTNATNTTNQVITTSTPTLTPTSTPAVAVTEVAESLPKETNTAEVINKITKTEENINQAIAVLEQEKKLNQSERKAKNDFREDASNGQDKNDERGRKDMEERDR